MSGPWWAVPVTLALAGVASAASAQAGPGPEGEAAAGGVASDTPPSDSGREKADILIAPAPFASPSSGFGVAGGVVALYNPNDTPHQWISGGGIAWTTRGTKAIAAFHKMSSRTDSFRLTAAASYANRQNNYYGTGEADGDRGDALQLEDKQFLIKLDVSFLVLPNVYAGVRYSLATHDSAPDEDPDEPPSLTPPPPADQLESTLSMFGPTLAYDSRDSHTQPRQGVQLTAAWLFGFEDLLDSYDHEKLSLEGHVYVPLSPRMVFAASAALCSASGEVPYYDLCLFGSSADLRGYPSGRYRDRASWAVQGELRRQLSTRWGGVAFFGLGGIAPSVGGIVDDGNLLPAGGIGVRYRPFKDNDVQLRVDVAAGKNDHGIYLGFGEAF